MRVWIVCSLLCAAMAVGWSQTYTISKYAGGGGPPAGAAATSVDMQVRLGVTVDGSGNVYFSAWDSCVFKYLPNNLSVTRVAGTCQGGYSGDGGSATTAQLNTPQGLAVDGNGNLYIADQMNSRIRKVTTDGLISTVAGTGTAGYSGDGGPATSAQLKNPLGVAVDSAGNLYISDSLNSRIRKVAPNGTISTIAGTGTFGYSGDGGPAISAQIGTPTSIGLDGAGNLYFSDGGVARVRKISTSGTITTIAGTGVCCFSGDGGPATSAKIGYSATMVVDAAGTVYIGDNSNLRIRQVSTSGTITTIAGTGTPGSSGDGGPATSAQLMGSVGVAISGSSLYVTDYTRLRRISLGGNITSVVGTGNLPNYVGDNGLATSAQLFHPDGLATDASGNLYIGDGSRIRKVTAGGTGTITTVAGSNMSGYSGDGSPAISAAMRLSQGVAVDTAGNLFIADPVDYRIRKVNSSGVISTLAGTGTLGYSGDGGTANSAQLTSPGGLAVDASGSLYFTDQNRIRKITTGGIISTVAGGSLNDYTGDGGPATNAKLSYPQALSFDTAGNVYIADSLNNVIRRIDTGGIITTVAGSGTMGFAGDDGPATSAQLNKPMGVAVDRRGNLYIADTYNCRVRKVNTSGVISTIAGTGTCGYTGDNGPATSARLDVPTGIAVDSSGRVYVASINSAVVRQLLPSAVPASIGADLDGDGKADLLWQNDSTRQVAVWYLSGANGNTLRTDAWVAQNGPQGWRAVGMSDFNDDGKADLVWQNDTTRQVAVWYLGGAQGNTVQSDAWIAANGPQGWRAVGLADFNGDGKPDLVWQHDTTREVVVWYLGGPNGNTFQSDAALASNGPANWRVVALADFNGDGKVDLVWQNDATRQVAVWYMGGTNGSTFQSDGWIAANGPQGWRVAGATDCNGDSKADLVWQNDTTRQAVVWYLGGANGNVFQSDAALTSSEPRGWTLIAP